MEKLTIQNVVEAFAAKGLISKKSSEALARTFFEVIVEGLNADGVVKINGLGTFKVISVADRESVNVNNGKRIVIEGYRKVTFTPSETAFMNPENSSVSSGKPSKKKTAPVKKTKVVLKEPEVNDADLQENQFSEIDMIISTPESLKDVRGHLEEAKNRAEKTLEEANVALAEKVKYEKMLKEMESVEVKDPNNETGAKGNKDDNTVSATSALPSSSSVNTGATENNNGGKKWIFIVLALLVVAFLIWLFARSDNNSNNEQPAPVQPQVPVVPSEPEDTVEQQKTYVMQPGDFLARISRNVYGTEDSVAAIIRLNGFTNPDSIPVGSTILLP